MRTHLGGPYLCYRPHPPPSAFLYTRLRKEGWWRCWLSVGPVADYIPQCSSVPSPLQSPTANDSTYERTASPNPFLSKFQLLQENGLHILAPLQSPCRQQRRNRSSPYQSMREGRVEKRLNLHGLGCNFDPRVTCRREHFITGRECERLLRCVSHSVPPSADSFID